MQKEAQMQLNSDEWVTIRDFTEGESDYTLPKYEAKFVTDVDKDYVENEVVLVKLTSSIDGSERLYNLPREVFEGVADNLP